MVSSEEGTRDEVSFGFAIPTYGEYANPDVILALVEHGERLGYADVWFADRVTVPSYALPFCDPNWYESLACAFTALGHTRQLRVGTDVLVLPFREPLVLARMIATAGLLSGSRFVLGVGVGYMQGEFEALDVDSSARGAITDEYLTILRTAWAAENPVTHTGVHRQFSDLHTGPRLEPGTVPIWVGGNHAAAYRRAARFGDGWHPLFPTPEVYARGKDAIDTAREREHRAAAPFTWSYSCPETKVLDGSGRDHVSFTYAEVGEIPADFAYAPAPPTDDGRPRFIGSVEEVAADVNCFVDAGVRHFTLRFWAGSPGFGIDEFVAQLERFRNEVVPRVRHTPVQ
jgi:alkanesulfonate monooxygenase SsuD/methylene tetrahydromethanopterin reductase-like flavin-dependent oxidoreductase (luciferase family)